MIPAPSTIRDLQADAYEMGMMAALRLVRERPGLSLDVIEAAAARLNQWADRDRNGFPVRFPQPAAPARPAIRERLRAVLCADIPTMAGDRFEALLERVMEWHAEESDREERHV